MRGHLQAARNAAREADGGGGCGDGGGAGRSKPFPLSVVLGWICAGSLFVGWVVYHFHVVPPRYLAALEQYRARLSPGRRRD